MSRKCNISAPMASSFCFLFPVHGVYPIVAFCGGLVSWRLVISNEFSTYQVRGSPVMETVFLAVVGHFGDLVALLS